MRITNDYLFFWGGIFSNFHPCAITHGDLNFTSSEQLFMWFKAIHFKDFETADRILNAISPKEAKELGRAVKNFNNDEWTTERYRYMFRAISLKFTQNKTLLDQLLCYHNSGKIFVEASPFDMIWGVGMSIDDPEIESSDKWRGLNLLGKVLNELAVEIRDRK